MLRTSSNNILPMVFRIWIHTQRNIVLPNCQKWEMVHLFTSRTAVMFHVKHTHISFLEWTTIFHEMFIRVSIILTQCFGCCIHRCVCACVRCCTVLYPDLKFAGCVCVCVLLGAVVSVFIYLFFGFTSINLRACLCLWLWHSTSKVKLNYNNIVYMCSWIGAALDAFFFSTASIKHT